MAEARSFVEKIQQTDLTGGRERVHTWETRSKKREVTSWQVERRTAALL